MTIEQALNIKTDLKLRAQAEADYRKNLIMSSIPEYAAGEEIIGSFPSRMLAIVRSKENVQERLNELKSEIDAVNSERRRILAAHGYPEDHCDPHYSCELCNDSGRVGDKLCQCVKRMVAEANYAESGIGKALLDKTFENFSLDHYKRTPPVGDEKSEYDRMKKVLAKCRAFADRYPDCGNLLLIGGTGLGKTHLSAAIAKSVIERGYSAHYETAPAIFACFDAVRFGRRDPGDTDVYYDVGLLVIDDLGSEARSSQNVSLLFELINTRLLNGRSTVISTNLTSSEITRNYNERIASRLFGEYTALQFTGTDLRLKKL